MLNLKRHMNMLILFLLQVPTTNQDDEYANVGEQNPLVLLTTSRDPSSRLRQFLKELTHIFPSSIRMNRGRYVIEELVDISRRNNVSDLIIIHEHRGEPDGMIISHFPYGPTTRFSLHNVVLRHDTNDRSTVAEQYPNIIFDNFTSNLGARIQTVLKSLFPVPKDDSKRVISFSNIKDFISFRHHVFLNVNNDVHLTEVGPRFEMRPYQIKLGTVEVDEADVEWAYRPYIRTANKHAIL